MDVVMGSIPKVIPNIAALVYEKLECQDKHHDLSDLKSGCPRAEERSKLKSTDKQEAPQDVQWPWNKKGIPTWDGDRSGSVRRRLPYGKRMSSSSGLPGGGSAYRG
jgi:hypothetical protein